MELYIFMFTGLLLLAAGATNVCARSHKGKQAAIGLAALAVLANAAAAVVPA